MLYSTVSKTGGEKFTAETFLLALRKSSELWHGGHPKLDPHWFFRGQRDASWGLTPSAWRPNAFSNARLGFHPVLKAQGNMAFFDQIDGEIRQVSSVGDEKFHKLSESITKEIKAVGSFQRLAAKCGYSIPKFPITIGSGKEVNNANNGMNVIEWRLDSGNLNWEALWELVGIAQHNGIPTRFLDATLHPWKACHFAISGWEDHERADVAVWAIKNTPGHVYFERPTSYRNDRLMAQEGLLFQWRNAEKWFLEHGSWPTMPTIDYDSMDQELQELETPAKPHLIKFVLAAEHVPDLAELLYREHITEAHLMASYESVANTLKQRWALGKVY